MYQSGQLAALADGNAEVAMEPGTAPVVHTPAAATKATIDTATPAADQRIIVRGLHASIACGATPQTPIRVSLIDDPAGASVVKFSKKLSAPANSCATVDVTGLCIVGSPGKPMRWEFAAAGVAASEEDVTMAYLTITNKS